MSDWLNDPNQALEVSFFWEEGDSDEKNLYRMLSHLSHSPFVVAVQAQEFETNPQGRLTLRLLVWDTHAYESRLADTKTC